MYIVRWYRPESVFYPCLLYTSTKNVVRVAKVFGIDVEAELGHVGNGDNIDAMVDAEWQARADKRFNRLMKEAHLRYPAADLDETIYRPERQLDTQTIERLSTCHWIEEGKNLIVTGASASGKTYLINAFCVTAMKQSKSVKYIKANTLMSEMEQARIKSTNLDYLNKLTKLDLLVIDDFGLMDLDLDKCRDLFEVLDTRDGRKSTVVISQFPVST